MSPPPHIFEVHNLEKHLLVGANGIYEISIEYEIVSVSINFRSNLALLEIIDSMIFFAKTIRIFYFGNSFQILVFRSGIN